MATLLLVRHGQSTWNAQRRWQGQADPPLSELGEQQADRAAVALAQRAPSIGQVFSSPQIRAARTAERLMAGSHAIDPSTSLELVADLRERAAGPWSGLTAEEINRDYPGFLSSGQRPDGYEADGPLLDRVRAALLNLSIRDESTASLVVCHGGVINVLVQHVHGIDDRVPNLSGYVATISDGDLTIENRFDLLAADERTGGNNARV